MTGVFGSVGPGKGAGLDEPPPGADPAGGEPAGGEAPGVDPPPGADFRGFQSALLKVRGKKTQV